jgi:hypothetical protein
MGLRDDDMYISLHRQGAWPGFTRELRHHHGAAGIDVSVIIPPSAWSGLVTAAGNSDAAVFQALAEFCSTEFLTDIGSVGIVRQLILDLDAH